MSFNDFPLHHCGGNHFLKGKGEYHCRACSKELQLAIVVIDNRQGIPHMHVYCHECPKKHLKYHFSLSNYHTALVVNRVPKGALPVFVSLVEPAVSNRPIHKATQKINYKPTHPQPVYESLEGFAVTSPKEIALEVVSSPAGAQQLLQERRPVAPAGCVEVIKNDFQETSSSLPNDEPLIIPAPQIPERKWKPEAKAQWEKIQAIFPDLARRAIGGVSK